jgi:hypothetical protein
MKERDEIPSDEHAAVTERFDMSDGMTAGSEEGVVFKAPGTFDCSLGGS